MNLWSRWFFALLSVESALLCCQAQTRPQTSSEAAKACVSCHAQAKTQPATSMAHALEYARGASLLAKQPVQTFQDGGYSYRIERKGEQSVYSVTDGQQTLSFPIDWAVGAGYLAQTYVLEKDGVYYESRVSYFNQIKGLDVTIGQQGSRPQSLLEAAGRRMEASETTRCFGCHATDAIDGKRLTLDKMTPGVQCGHCHADSSSHLLRAVETGSDPGGMKKLGTLSAEETLNFCGQCHRTLEEILTLGKRDLNSVRFQPYRLALSQCYDPDDKRIACASCHDPHVEIVRDVGAYDVKCQACHGGSKPKAVACRVAKTDCASCHMPKFDLPGAHHKFSDHRIRVVKVKKSGEAEF